MKVQDDHTGNIQVLASEHVSIECERVHGAVRCLSQGCSDSGELSKVKGLITSEQSECIVRPIQKAPSEGTRCHDSNFYQGLIANYEQDTLARLSSLDILDWMLAS